MSVWLDKTLVQAQSVEDWLSPARKNSLALLKQAAWPTRKVEDWKYTSVAALERKAVDLPLATRESAIASVDKVDVISGLDTLDLVFVNGFFMQGLSSDHGGIDGLTVTSLEGGSVQQNWAASLFAQIKPQRHFFGLVNDVLAQEGVLIDIADGTELSRPVRLLNIFNAAVQSHNRVVVRLGAGASATVIEQFSGGTQISVDAQSVNTHFAEYSVEAEAKLTHYRFGLQTGEAIAIGGSHFKLSNKSQLNSTLVGFGSDLSRLNIDVVHGGEYADAKVNAIYLLDKTELFDLHSNIEHAMPNGTTTENVRGIVADRSRAVFNGRIHIHRDAQKTLAELNNRNLLLSDKAEIDTKPELEIYADDVKCAHGATVAQIDKTALYYLQTRGVDPEQGKVMLNFAFINELVEQMPDQALAEWLQPQLRARFAAMQVSIADA